MILVHVRTKLKKSLTGGIESLVLVKEKTKLIQLQPGVLHAQLRQHTSKGTPKYFALENDDQLLVCPAPDKRYFVQIIGSVIVVL